MEDSRIIDLFFQRSGDAVAALSGKYANYCYTIAYNILSSAEDAEECVNDTYLGVWNAIPPHRPLRLSAFVGKITRRLAFNRRRALQTEKRGGGALPLILEELEECTAGGEDTYGAVEDAELERSINRFLHALPERDCNVFLRRYWYAEPLQDITKRYGLKENTVKTILYRTRQKLKAHLEKEGILL